MKNRFPTEIRAGWRQRFLAIARESLGAVRKPGTDNRTSHCAFTHRSFRF